MRSEPGHHRGYGKFDVTIPFTFLLAFTPPYVLFHPRFDGARAAGPEGTRPFRQAYSSGLASG
jgi:hypothetical protein